MMITYEILLRLILTAIVIGVPIALLVKKYGKLLYSFIITRQENRKKEAAERKLQTQQQIENAKQMISREPVDEDESPKKEPSATSETIDQVGSQEQKVEEKAKEQEQETKDAIGDEGKGEKKPHDTTRIAEVQDIITDDTPTNSDDEKTTPSVADSDKIQKQIESIKYSALSYKERGKLDMYEKKLIEGLALDPDNKTFLKMLSNHYFDQANHIKALTLLKRIIQDDPKNHKAIRQIGQIYREQGDSDAARILIEKSISLKPDNPSYLISMVEIHYDSKEPKEAIKLMEKLIKLRPTNTDYLLTLATLHEEVSEPTKAEYYYMKTLEFDPQNDHAKTALHRLHI